MKNEKGDITFNDRQLTSCLVAGSSNTKNLLVSDPISVSANTLPISCVPSLDSSVSSLAQLHPKSNQVRVANSLCYHNISIGESDQTSSIESKFSPKSLAEDKLSSMVTFPASANGYNHKSQKDHNSYCNKHQFCSHMQNSYERCCFLKPSQWLLARFGNNDFRLAKVLEYRPVDGLHMSKAKSPEDFMYYVHFQNINRRMDCWLCFHDLLPIDPKTKHLLTSNTNNASSANCSFCAIKGSTDSDTTTDLFSRLLLFDPSLYFSDQEADPDEHEGMDRSAILAHEEATRIKNINKIKIGSYTLETWYYSPFPYEYHNVDVLYICEWCLCFFKYETELIKHLKGCCLRHPPGDEIYRDHNLSVFEVDGQLARVYSENLCYLAKLFLDHKTLQYDVEPFLFYILTEVDSYGCHIVGYFSKEKVSMQGYNVACILTLPQHQRKGYGKFLITLSYHLSLIEGKFGTPEKPLSDLGRVSYRCWWTHRLLTLLKNLHGKVSLEDLVRMTAIRRDDIQRTLEEIGILRYVQGQHLIVLQPDYVESRLRETGKPGAEVKRRKLHFVPFCREKSEFDIPLSL